MPKTLQEIIDHADEMAAAFENYEPDPEDCRSAEPLRQATDAVKARAEAEQAVATAVEGMRHADYSWAAIGAVLGTSAEAARQRYGVDHERKSAAGRGFAGRAYGVVAAGAPAARTLLGNRGGAKSQPAGRTAAKKAALDSPADRKTSKAASTRKGSRPAATGRA